MTHIAPPIQALDSLAETLRLVREEGERIVIDREGQAIAALISLDELRLLERLLEEEEDRVDAAEVARIKAEMAATGEKPIPWDEVKARLDRLEG